MFLVGNHWLKFLGSKNKIEIEEAALKINIEKTHEQASSLFFV